MSAPQPSPEHIDAVVGSYWPGGPMTHSLTEARRVAGAVLSSTAPDVHAAMLDALVRAGVLTEDTRQMEDGMAGTVWQPDGTNRHIFRAPTIKRRLVTVWEQA